jgi:hypothetical protein
MTELLPHRKVTTGIPGEGCAICKTPPPGRGFFGSPFPEPIHNPQKKEPHMYQQTPSILACEHCGHGQHHPIHQDFRPVPPRIVYTMGDRKMSKEEYEGMLEQDQKDIKLKQRQAKQMGRRMYDRGDLAFWTLVPGFIGGTVVTFILGSVLGW